MNREQLYHADSDKSTFYKDEELPPLPLPKLEDTLTRYMETLKPFGTEDELKNSERIIEQFKNGIGRELHKALEEKAKTEKNWVEKWWEDYAYHTLRMPLYPYAVMTMPLILESVGIPESKEFCLKAAAMIMYHTLEFHDLLRREKLRPSSSANGEIFLSSNLYKRFLSTTRVPGVEQDKIESHFKCLSEGEGPTHYIIMGKGRIFQGSVLNPDGSIISPEQIHIILQNIRASIDQQNEGDCVPILTCDDRSTWANNRSHLKELSIHNKNALKLVESSVIMMSLDESEPIDYTESSLLALTGDVYSRWADRSSINVIFKNGKHACIGEHSAYDGTISISYSLFVLLSILERPEHDWDKIPEIIHVPTELKFDIDQHIKNEIERVKKDHEARRQEIIVQHSSFEGFGKDFMKIHRLHPDSFIQMVIQLTYYKMHKEYAATYETALMRHYYHGRTETIRSCTPDCVDFLQIATREKSSKVEIYESFRKAVTAHNKLMVEARKGNGVDRHLFGLWCAAYDRNIDIPELYSDPLYNKSGGGGNFVLSTSTLGFSICTGYVAPMVLDGYGIFYSITSDVIYMHVAVYRESNKTSAHKFFSTFCETMTEIKNCIEESSKSRL